MKSVRCSAGFSLVELLIAVAITATITGLACGLAIEAQAIWRADSARVDLHQRIRVVSDILTRALLESGAGPHVGPSRGPLLRAVAPVLPRRIGLRGADAPTVFRTDAFTVLRTLPEAEHASLLLPAPAGATFLEIAPLPACRLPACGFSEGMTILLLDSHGNSDLFTIVRVAGLTLDVRHKGTGSVTGYAAGSSVLAVESTSYYLDNRSRVVRTYDGDTSDMPLVDDVVGMEVTYYADVRPPLSPRPAMGTANCLYDADGAYQTALLPVLPTDDGPMAVLSGDMVTDGPWCGSGDNRFDADLLRVRRVRVLLRLQASDPAARGIDQARFRVRGTGRRSAAMVPDVTVAVDVTPRNLRQGW